MVERFPGLTPEIQDSQYVSTYGFLMASLMVGSCRWRRAAIVTKAFLDFILQTTLTTLTTQYPNLRHEIEKGLRSGQLTSTYCRLTFNIATDNVSAKNILNGD